jgi:hypothetical protein
MTHDVLLDGQDAALDVEEYAEDERRVARFRFPCIHATHRAASTPAAQDGSWSHVRAVRARLSRQAGVPRERLRSHPSNLIRVMPAKGGRQS